MLNTAGELSSAIIDKCNNYDPNNARPTKVRSDKSGVIYDCRNFAKIPEEINSCLGCYNWQEQNGTYVHEKERKRDNFE